MCLISRTVRSTRLLWLPLLANIEPPALRRVAVTDRLLNKVELHPDWLLHDDIIHPLNCDCLRSHSGEILWQWMCQVGGVKTGSRRRGSTPHW